MPGDIDFSVVLKLTGTREEFAESTEIEAYLLGPGMKALGDLSFRLRPIDFPAGYPAGWEFGHLHPFAVALTAEQWGEHVLELYLSSTERRSVFFRVSQP